MTDTMRCCPLLSTLSALLLVAVASGLSITPTTQQSVDVKNCDTCMWATSSFQALLAHSDLQPLMVTAAQAVCQSVAGEGKAQCFSLAENLVPETMEWLRRPEAAVQMCSAANVCNSASIPSLTQVGMRQMARETVRDDAMCSMCEHVIGNAQTLDNTPITQNEFTQRAMAACSELPGDMVSSCARMVELYVPQVLPVAGRMDAWSTCAVAGLCTGQLLDHVPLPAFPATLVQRMIPMQQVVTQAQKITGQACDGCRMAMLELNLLVKSPAVQQQLMDYAKSLCSGLGADASDTCKHYVDLYGPAVFQELQKYLQTDVICQGIGMCSAITSSVSSLSTTVSSNLQWLASIQAQKQMLRGQAISEEFLAGAPANNDVEAMGRMIAAALHKIVNSRAEGRWMEAQQIEEELAATGQYRTKASSTDPTIEYYDVYDDGGAEEDGGDKGEVLGGVDEADALVGGADESRSTQQQSSRAGQMGADQLYERLALIADGEEAAELRDGEEEEEEEGVNGPFYDVYYAGYYDSAYNSEYDQWVQAAGSSGVYEEDATHKPTQGSKEAQAGENPVVSALVSNAKWLHSFWSTISALGGGSSSETAQRTQVGEGAEVTTPAQRAGAMQVIERQQPVDGQAVQETAARLRPALQRTAGSGKGSGMKSMKPALMMGRMEGARRKAARKMMA